MEQRCIDYFNKWQAMDRGKRADAMTVLAELYYQGHGTNKNLKNQFNTFVKHQYTNQLMPNIEQGFFI